MASEVPEFLTEPELLRDYLVDYLGTKDDLAGGKINSRKVANLQNEIERSLARDGNSITVFVPTLKPKPYQSAAILCDPAHIVVRVTVDGLKNKTGKSALFFATRIAAHLQLHTPPFPFVGEIIVTELRELNIISGDPNKEDEDDLSGWDVLAQCRLSLTPRSTTD